MTKVLFIINQFFKGGAESALLNLLKSLHPENYEIDLIIYDQIRLKDTVTLIDEIPDWVNVFNAAEEENRIAFVKKAAHKLWRKVSGGVQLYRRSVYQFVQSRHYDTAISFGEWFSCSLVAKYVHARRKYVWVHADMDKASFLYPDLLTLWQCFDRYLFVSGQSYRAAAERYPFLKDRGLVLHNVVDVETILRDSQAACQMPALSEKLPILVTVANIRPEKNHPRQIQVMQELFRRGLRFYWLNVGNLANIEQTRKVRRMIAQAGLEDYFLLTGARENPYPIIRQADAVCVLSDYESWSMVITEAVTLGVPVIATKTSGALEQLEDGETGLLCDFNVENIANQIQRFFTRPELSDHIRQQLSIRRSLREDLQQIEALLKNDRKKLLYVFDDINYTSGARSIALQQMKYLSTLTEVEAFSSEPCRDETLNETWRIWDLSDNQAFRSLSVPIRQVFGGSYSTRTKLVRLLYAMLARVHLDTLVFESLFQDEVSSHMAGYDTVCVVSEASKLRSCVATLKGPKKVQWIHTDYAAWSQLTSWTRAITRRDGKLYEHYDAVVCLSRRLRERFLECHPGLAERTIVIPNLIEVDRILRMAEEPSAYQPQEGVLNLISVGRMEHEKRYDRLLAIAAELKKHRAFHWFFVGDGLLLEEMKSLCHEMALEECITFTGALKNPYPLMKRCDLFVLFSEYEGTPVTIEEAKVLGLPVLANDVGGVADQLAGAVSSAIFNTKEAMEEYLCTFKLPINQGGGSSRQLSSTIQEHEQIAVKQLLSIIENGGRRR